MTKACKLSLLVKLRLASQHRNLPTIISLLRENVRRPSAPLAPGVLSWLSLWMAFQEMVKDM
jgi:hypothetical protein